MQNLSVSVVKKDRHWPSFFTKKQLINLNYLIIVLHQIVAEHHPVLQHRAK